MKNSKLLEVTLEHYRVHINEYDRWLSEFPDICRLLENLKAQSEWHSGIRPVDISVLRDEIRAMRRPAPTAPSVADAAGAKPIYQLRYDDYWEDVDGETWMAYVRDEDKRIVYAAPTAPSVADAAGASEPIDILLDRLKNGEDYTTPLLTKRSPAMTEAWTYEQVVMLCETDGVPLPAEFIEWVAEKMTRAANEVLLAAGASEGQAFDAWFDREYPIDDLGRRSKYQNTSVLDLMQAAWSARDAEIAALRKERDQALLDAEQARNERNRVGVEIRRELMTEATAQIAALRERIAGMEKDAERLDWLDRNASSWFHYETCQLSFDVPDDFEGANNVRTLIDAAIAEEKKCS